MLFYTVRRLNLFVVTLLILSIVGFSILRLDETSSWSKMYFWSGWLIYVFELINLNFGINRSGAPILEELLIVFPATLELCFIAFLISILLGVPLGMLSGIKQGTWIDATISFASMVGYSTPLFWTALLFIMIFSLHSQILPISGRFDLLYQVEYVTGFALIDVFFLEEQYRVHSLKNIIKHLILPCLVLALSPTTQVIRLIRNSVAETMTQNYIQVLKIKGLTTYAIIIRHVFKNAIAPIIPKIGIQLSNMLTLAIVTESIFDWPGIGNWLLDALEHKDYTAIQAGVIAIAILVLSANTLSDLFSVMVNPLARRKWCANK
ncbi:peptide ABC transporter permease protein [Candidatus Photodesmus blepharus]|uniref:Peptide ABC transporter permease protein n=1 Tax=Candidatus Photodesmus blepharonis TaxID=1179155 RepID=A0A084CN42_9GAMM|nr:ABC transporter permease subunit [Candidatus Photodesmus blepharus]KEY91221.1 peptide ABC transporter permease protein [Candidatus Photodesmus blepharus]